MLPDVGAAPSVAPVPLLPIPVGMAPPPASLLTRLGHACTDRDVLLSSTATIILTASLIISKPALSMACAMVTLASICVALIFYISVS